MLKSFARTVCLSAALAAGAIGLTSAPAAANDFEFGITIGGPSYGGGHYVRDRGYCEPRRALRIARREFGLRDAQIIRDNRRAVVVDGFRRGDYARVRFAQEHGCPVISVRGR